MSEQQSETTTTTERETIACPHPEAVGKRWGDPITAERQAELQGYLDQWHTETDHGKRKGPFHFLVYIKVSLTGADVFWLSSQLMGSLMDDYHPEIELAGAMLNGAHLEGAGLHLHYLNAEGAHLRGAHLEGASLGPANFKRASLSEAHLEGTQLGEAHLEDAYLRSAHLEGASLTGTRLEGANLIGASFDKASRLNDAVLTGVGFDQVTFDNTNLTVVDWSLVNILGDERSEREFKDSGNKASDRYYRVRELKAAVRANRVLAVALRNQGMNEDADRFAYRAQFLQQQVLCRQRKFGGYFFSRFLDVLAGYGYYPGRAVGWYLATVFGFACAYFFIGHTSGVIPGPVDALVFSLTSFHGRGFFPSENISLHSPVIVVAALEAVIGLLIEISFIATFTQRFFGR